jgi:Protein of unknown function (DUF5818)
MRFWNPGVLVVGLASAVVACGQASPTDVVPSQAAIVWTGAQQPVPEPAPDTSAREIPPAQQGTEENAERSPEQREQPGVQKPGQNPGDSNNASPASSENTRSINGTVVREGSSYFLKTDDNSEFQLDDAAKVRGFENQAVRITGTIDSSTRTIHVQTIKPTT